MASDLGSLLVPIPRPDPRGPRPDPGRDVMGEALMNTPVPTIMGLHIRPGAWESFIASQPQSQNVERGVPLTPYEEAQVTMGQAPRYGIDPYPVPPTLEEQGRVPNELAAALGYSGIDQYFKSDPKIEAILKTMKRLK